MTALHIYIYNASTRFTFSDSISRTKIFSLSLSLLPNIIKTASPSLLVKLFISSFTPYHCWLWYWPLGDN